MKILLAAFLFVFALPASPQWHADMHEAQKAAAENHHYILLNFSGSDWCIPCIKMHKEIFDNQTFKAWAGDHLELVNADFPRLKKNQLSKEQTSKNEALAGQYNTAGSFPYTVLLTADGKLVKAWEGYSGVSAEAFTAQLKQLTGDRLRSVSSRANHFQTVAHPDGQPL